MKKIQFLFFVLFFIPLVGTSQLLEYQRFTIHDGLSQSIIYSAAEDAYQRLWFATYDGISIFDGTRFTTIQSDQGLPLPVVFHLYPHDGSMYAILRGKIVRISIGNYNITTLSHPPEIKFYYNQLFKTSDRLFLTDNQSVYSVNNDSVKVFEKASFFGLKKISSVWSDSTYALFSDESALVVTRLEANSFRIIEKFTIKGITDITRSGNHWIVSTQTGLTELKLGQPPKVVYRSVQAIKQVTTYKSEFLITTSEGAISLHQLNGELMFTFDKKNGLPVESLNDLYTDFQCGVWLLTVGEGLVRISNFLIQNYNNGNGFSAYPVYGLQKTGNSILVSTLGHGIQQINQQAIKEKEWFKGKTVYQMVRDRLGTIWVAVDSLGIFRKNGDSFIPFKYNDQLSDRSPRAIHFDPLNRLWIGSNHELLFFDGSSIRRVLDRGLDGEPLYITDIESLSPNNILVATEFDGLFQYTDGHYSRVAGDPVLKPDMSVKSIFIDKDSTIWVGASEGLFKSKRGYYWKKIPLDKETTSGVVWDINQDLTGRIWVTTSLSLKQLVNDRDVLTIDRGIGLIPSELNRFSFLDDGEGSIWIGGMGNLAKVSADFFSKMPEVGTLYLSRYESSRSKAHGLNEKEFEKPLEWFRFELGMTDYLSRGKVQYRYRNLAKDTTWLPFTQSNVILFNDFDPGQFEIEFQAKDKYQRLSNTEEIYFTVPVPFHRTIWFVIIIIVVIAVVVIGIDQWRSQTALKHKLKLEADVRDRTQALTEAMRFIENMVEFSTEVIFTTDAEGQIEIWNNQAERYFRSSKTEMIGSSIKTLQKQSDQKTLHDLYLRVKQGEIITKEKLNLADEFEEFHLVLVNAYPLRNETGKITKIVFLLTDIQDHQLLEKELLEKERFIASLQAMKDTLSTITHYINNAVTVFMGVADMARDKEKYKDKLVEVSIEQGIEIQAVIKSLENLNDKMKFKTHEYPDQSHFIFDIQQDIEKNISLLKIEKEAEKKYKSGHP